MIVSVVLEAIVFLSVAILLLLHRGRHMKRRSW
jgi:hypothetical protein